jgi:uncharacterized protein
MELSFTFFAFAVPAVLFVGLSKGGFGNGAGFAATPFLALILTPGEAIGLLLPLFILMDVTALRAYWKQWHWPSARALITGALPGVALGAALFSLLDGDLFKVMIGVVAIAFVAFQGVKKAGLLRPASRPMGAKAGWLAGTVSGFTSFVSHAGGPPASVYLLSQKLSKTEHQATTVVVFFVINLLKLVPYMALGFFSKTTLLVDVALAPVALGGVMAGVWLHRFMPERLFFGFTYLFLLITGSKLILDGI